MQTQEPQNIFEAVRTAIGETEWESETMCQKTNARPGSREKVQVIADRVQAGQQLWHQDDAASDSDGAYGEPIMRQVRRDWEWGI